MPEYIRRRTSGRNDFSDNYDEINQRLEQVVEFVRITLEEEDFPAQYFFDVRPSLKRIRVEGMYMDEQELFDLRRSLETIRDIVRFLQQSDEEEETENSPYPALRELAGDILVFPQLIARIDSILDKFGKIKDNASAELLRIRRELSATTGSISRSLNSILRAAQSEGYVDKDVTPTMRDGRLVIPVAPGMKRKSEVLYTTNQPPERLYLLNRQKWWKPITASVSWKEKNAVKSSAS